MPPSSPTAPVADGCRFWLHGFPVPGQTEAFATEAERLGYDGVLLADSQSLVGDVFVELALAARATSQLGIGTGVTNPVTRHPAVTAGAAASLQAESLGRAVLGIGRGDSALARLGVAQPGTAELVAFVDRVRAYLRGDVVGAGGRLEWLPGTLAPVPVEVAATGPATIAAAALHADRVMLTVGADPARISAAIVIARAARGAAGLDPDRLAVGAYVNIGCHPSPPVARDLVRGSAAIFARFSAGRHGGPDALSPADTATVARLSRVYVEQEHGLSAAAHAAMLDDRFVDRFTVVGPVARCVERLADLVALGLDRVVLVPGSRDSDPELLAGSNALVAVEVLPALRAGGRR